MAEEQTTGPGSIAQPDRLAVTFTAVHDIGVVTPVGELDLNNVDFLRRTLDEAATTYPRLVLDLHGLTFIDSTGINIFIATHQALARAGGWLRLAAPTDTVSRALEIVGITTVIDCCPTLHDALTA